MPRNQRRTEILDLTASQFRLKLREHGFCRILGLNSQGHFVFSDGREQGPLISGIHRRDGTLDRRRTIAHLLAVRQQRRAEAGAAHV